MVGERRQKSHSGIQENSKLFCRLSVGLFISTKGNAHPLLEKEIFCKRVSPVQSLGGSSAEKTSDC